MIDRVLKDKVKSIVKDEKPIAVLLVGSAVKHSKKDFHKLKDIDIFVINERDKFHREVSSINDLDFDISYLPISLLRKAIDDKISSLISILHNCIILYKSNSLMEEYLNEIKRVYKKGPEQLGENHINYLRFKLSQKFENILSKQNEEMNTIFLLNSFVEELLRSYFMLNGIWMPSDKKIIYEINKSDNILYDLVVNYYKSYNIDEKIHITSNMLNHVLSPYGGELNNWVKSEYPFDFE